ncbi:LysR family transcriptional regulator [Nitrincola alkalisediminis]|uniref:LysR family transcriptional regulator n=1 Tax=Nitrincola alkalisediminis TaxID=1366656 RepID=UPI0018740DE9|nr:LysR substrate-binding domain-containing protein [Nitrincola alkalisediminis]
MDLKQIEYFVRVAELGSFTKASIDLNIAQPALSRQVRLLEVELGQSLLLRNGRGVSPTEGGKLLLEHGRGIMYQIERTREELSKLKGSLVGRVAVGMPPSLSKLLTLPLVNRFNQVLPDVSLSISEGLSSQMAEALQSGNLDIALLYNAQAADDIELLPLGRERLYLVRKGTTADRIHVGDAISLKTLTHERLITPSSHNAMRLFLQSEMVNLGLRPNIILEIDGVAIILDLVASGQGAGVLSMNAVKSLGRHHCFDIHPIVDPDLSIKLYLATSNRRPSTHTQLAMLKLIQEQTQFYVSGQLSER